MRKEAMPRTCWDRLPGDGFGPVCSDSGIYDTTEEKWLDRPVRQDHVNLDSGRRYRLLPRELQPDCGCDECLQLRLKNQREMKAGY
jgi:hypothetical protein